MEIVLVAAVAENGVIGRAGGMPWRLSADLKRFRARTWGRPVVMGRRTYAAIGAPLKGRTNIVVTRDPAFQAPGVVVTTSLDRALEAARGDALRRGVGEIVIGGGSDIYAATMAIATELDITRVHAAVEGDTFFPPIDPAVWQEVKRAQPDPAPGDTLRFTWLTYRRKPAPAAAR
jgi:dihydrofolate reductase